MLAVLASVGFGRFSYGVVAPLMAQNLGLNSLEVGLIATGQNTCYLIFGWLGGKIVGKVGFRRLVVVSLIFCGIFTLGTGAASNFVLALLSQSLVGVFSGLATIASYGFSIKLFDSDKLGRGVGVANTGPALGLALTGIIEPFFLRFGPELSWRFSWFAYGGIIVLIALVVCFILPATGSRRKTSSDGGKIKKIRDGETAPLLPSDRKVPYLLASVYFIFGLVYIMYVTYLPTFVVQQLGFGVVTAANIWEGLGFLSMVSSLLLGTLSDRIGRWPALSLAFFSIVMSQIISILIQSVAGIYVSAALFGIFLFGIPTVCIVSAGELRPSGAAQAIAFVTMFFGIGQALGPALAGYVITNLGHSYDSVFILSSLLGTSALVLSAFAGIGFGQRKR